MIFVTVGTHGDPFERLLGALAALVGKDGSNLRRLNELAESQPSLTWSADGDSIYAIGGGGFWKIDLASGNRELVGSGVPQGQILLLKGAPK